MEDKLVSSATQADLAAVLRSTKERLQNRLKTLKEKATSAGTLQEEVEIPQLASEIKTLESLIVAVKKELVDIDVMKELAVNTANSAGALESAVTAELDKDPTIAMYQSKIFELQSAIQQLQSASRNPSSANLKRLMATLEQTQSDMEQYRMGATKAARDRLAKMPNDVLRATLIEHDVRFKAASENLKEYENQLKTARDKLLSLGVQDPEMEILKQDIENETEIVKSLEQKVLEWEVMQKARERQENKASDLEKVSVIQEATAVPDINTIERWSIAGIGGVAALALTCYGIALLEFRRRRLNNPTDIDEGLGVRVLGVLPPTSLKLLTGNSLVATQVAEAIDNVRATLMHDSTSAPRQVVMVTSSGTMEGNTVVASSLALSLSRAGRRTLLVDGDLRAPALHKLFGMGLEDGLSEVLRSEIDVADAVRPTNNEGLYLLTAGVCSSEAIQALATDQPQVIFEKLRDQFDFIVIDAPPVLGISDSLSLGQYIDGAVLTVLRDHSEIRNVHKAVELLKSMDIRLIGAVVNGVPIKADRRVVRLHQASQRTPRLPASADH
jgi:capsular exopolysaccharide synthesis family protein